MAGKISLRTALLVPFVLQVLLAFSLVSFLAWRGGDQSISSLLERLAGEASDRIKVRIDRYMEKPHIVTRINADALRSGEVDQADLFSRPEWYFFRQQQQFPSINDVYFGRNDGAITGIDQSDGKYVLKITDVFPSRNFFAVDDKGNRGALLETNTYNSTTRGWYRDAVQKGAPVWSKIYVLKNKNKLGITAAEPAFDPRGVLQGVMGVNLTLEGISEFLSGVKLSPHTVLYIVERDGSLVASSVAGLPLFTSVEGEKEPRRLRAVDAANPVIAGSIKSLDALPGAVAGMRGEQMLRTQFDGESWFVHTSEYTDPKGLDWLIVAAINEGDFMGDVYRTLIQTAVLGIVLLAVVVLVGMAVARRLSRPVLALEQTARRIAGGDFGEPVVLAGATSEIAGLAESFNSMSAQLASSFEALGSLNRDLEIRVQERTADLQASREILQEAHENIRDSIRYGSLIQRTMLPTEESLSAGLDEHFILWEPKDTVGGDIYLFEKLGEGEWLLMLADCTGHGVPGAFVSMLVKAIERYLTGGLASKGKGILPAELLGRFNRHMKNLLKQNDSSSLSNVGFDGAILYYNREQGILRYAGAGIPLYVFRGSELEIYKGDRCSIGYVKSDANQLFSSYEIDVRNGVDLYLSTDGYLDQSGGEKGFCFGKKRFEALLREIAGSGFVARKERLENALRQYQGEEERHDDVTVVGLHIKAG